MYKVELDVPDDVLGAIIQDIPRYPGLMNTAVKKAVGNFRRVVLSKLRVEPALPTYPLRWKSLAQRRFVMRKLRAEGNLPYQRTHQLAQSWRMDFSLNSDGGLFEVVNPTPYADFVQGDNAQPFHLDTGWPQAAPILVEGEDYLFDQLVGLWYTVAGNY